MKSQAWNCTHCGCPDHWVRYCPERRVKLDGKPKKIHKDDFEKVEAFGLKVEKGSKYGTVKATPKQQAVLLAQGVILWDTL